MNPKTPVFWRLPRAAWFTLLILAFGASITSANAAPRLDPAGLAGTVMLTGSGAADDEVLRGFRELAGGRRARIVHLRHAKPQAPTDETPAESDTLLDDTVQSWDDPDFVAPLWRATALRIDADVELATLREPENLFARAASALLRRGGVILAEGASATLLVERTGETPATSWNLVPQVWLDAREQPGFISMQIDAGGALVIRGRQMAGLGPPGSVTLGLAAGNGREAREYSVARGTLEDYTMLRRAALDRAGEPFPPPALSEPRLESGSLVIVGGGRMPDEVTRRFLDLAGGPEALIVVLPTADEPAPRRNLEREGLFFRRLGARHVAVLPQRELDEISSGEFVETIRSAGGVWFGGGRQWRFVDAYAGTPAEDAFHEVLRRGGVIGGSSAGATIQGEYLVRGSPLGNTDMMAEGYERGLGFLPGVAIDQHFTQRKRFGDMSRVFDRFPQLIGFGLDEGTAAVVCGGTVEVIGDGRLHLYDRRRAADRSRDFTTFTSGSALRLSE